jgi:hypothetical protein
VLKGFLGKFAFLKQAHPFIQWIKGVGESGL